MTFHSLPFLLFFPAVLAVYWLLPLRKQNILLLAASYLFYGFVHPWFVGIMLLSTTVDYGAGQRMEDDPRHKKRYLAASLLVNLGMLAFFKYFNFFIENVRVALSAFGLHAAPTLEIRRSSCYGPASSHSASRSTPTSPPTRTSPAAWRAGSGSS